MGSCMKKNKCFIPVELESNSIELKPFSQEQEFIQQHDFPLRNQIPPRLRVLERSRR